jgi:hypothetical protein
MPDLSDFSDKSRDTLNAMSIAQVVASIGAPDEHVQYASVPGWKVGDGRPDLASDDPAVMQAMGRCAASRVRHKLPAMALERVHLSACGWCEYPLEEVLKACAWATMASRFVTADVLEWTNTEGRKYARPGTLTGYQNNRWATFWALPIEERERQIKAASGAIEASPVVEYLDALDDQKPGGYVSRRPGA